MIRKIINWLFTIAQSKEALEYYESIEHKKPPRRGQ